MISKLFDAINDPVIGYLSDKTKSKIGKRKVWMLLSVIPFLFVYFFMWYVPPFSPSMKVFYYQVMNILYSLFTSTFLLPFFAMAPELSKDYDERILIVSYRTTCGVIGIIFNLIFIIMFYYFILFLFFYFIFIFI